jgi:hypothetical protein
MQETILKIGRVFRSGDKQISYVKHLSNIIIDLMILLLPSRRMVPPVFLIFLKETTLIKSDHAPIYGVVSETNANHQIKHFR